MVNKMVTWHAIASAICGVAAAVVMSSDPLFAHHGLTAQFDRNQPVSLRGEIVRVEWQNPHIWIYINVTEADGSVQTWGLSSGSPFILQRQGITRDTLKAGEVIVVEGFRARDGSNNAAGQLRYADGRQLFRDQEVDDIR